MKSLIQTIREAETRSRPQFSFRWMKSGTVVCWSMGTIHWETRKHLRELFEEL